VLNDESIIKQSIIISKIIRPVQENDGKSDKAPIDIKVADPPLGTNGNFFIR